MVTLKFHCNDVQEDYLEIIKFETVERLLIIVTNKDNISSVNLDKSTAIKLSKELRKLIALLD